MQVNYTTMCHGLDQTGGEPFVYVDFLSLMEAIRNKLDKIALGFRSGSAEPIEQVR